MEETYIHTQQYASPNEWARKRLIFTCDIDIVTLRIVCSKLGEARLDTEGNIGIGDNQVFGNKGQSEVITTETKK